MIFNLIKNIFHLFPQVSNLARLVSEKIAEKLPNYSHKQVFDN